MRNNLFSMKMQYLYLHIFLHTILKIWQYCMIVKNITTQQRPKYNDVNKYCTSWPSIIIKTSIRTLNIWLNKLLNTKPSQECTLRTTDEHVIVDETNRMYDSVVALCSALRQMSHYAGNTKTTTIYIQDICWIWIYLFIKYM